ncbi:SDR family oxidoreductase [Candidatus Parcubacteria bacterium]|nr:SDR family oxidoreductase [Patescibacteria group bacterium]MBU4466620.1 SDR family oxidoreductase [Patescibacteria group bacterium]MCG2688354.1 SDR family oxidoreductase [Candidatus Parcubacteria bacterium]
MIDLLLKNKIALVTGANHGIGSAVAKALAKQGVKVFITYLKIENDRTKDLDLLYKERRSSSADKTPEEIRKDGGTADAFEVDLSDIKAIPVLFDKAEEIFGPVEILVNNAAYCDPDTFDPQVSAKETLTGLISSTISAEKYEKHFAVNAKASALMMEEFARRHKNRNARWGRVINVSTDWAECFPTSISYGASKAAMESYSRSAAVELGKYGITVNIVAPGPIQTGWMSKKVEELQTKHCPLGRIGQPEDVADVIVFLASEQAHWLTGQRLFVGGGNRVI